MKMIERLSPMGDLRTGLSAIGLSFPDAVVQGDPQEAAHVFYDQPLAQATIGIWSSEAGTVRFDAYPFDELCIVADGEVALISADGPAESFRAGDLFLVRKGWRGDWVMTGRLRKFYVELKAG